MGRILASLLLSTLLAPFMLAQTVGDRIDLYFTDWHSSSSHSDRGLEERDIFTRGDPQNPSQKGALLRFINSYTYSTLAPAASTKSARLDGQQEIYWVQSGRGTVTARAPSA